MSKLIKVSKHQFKTKVLATSELDRILSNRRDRIEKIKAPLVLVNTELEKCQKNLTKAIEKETKLIAESKDQKEIDNQVKHVLNLEYTMEGIRIRRSVIKKSVNLARSKYRISDYKAYSQYECIGSTAGQWIFQINK